MTIRTAAALTAAILALGAAPALAGKVAAPSCVPLITDVRGDGYTNDQEPSRDGLDIVSGSLATGRKTFVAELTLANLSSDPTMVHGATYIVNWRLGTVEQEVLLYRYAGGREIAEFDPDVAAQGTVMTTASITGNTIRWTVPRALNPALKGSRMKFSGIDAYAVPSVNVGTPPAVPVSFTSRADLLTGDDAWSSKTYTDLTPSCLKPA